MSSVEAREPSGGPWNGGCLSEASMTSSGYSLVVPLAGWLLAVTFGFVGYLVGLQIKEMRHNRRLHQERVRMGLEPA